MRAGKRVPGVEQYSTDEVLDRSNNREVLGVAALKCWRLVPRVCVHSPVATRPCLVCQIALNALHLPLQHSLRGRRSSCHGQHAVPARARRRFYVVDREKQHKI